MMSAVSKWAMKLMDLETVKSTSNLYLCQALRPFHQCRDIPPAGKGLSKLMALNTSMCKGCCRTKAKYQTSAQIRKRFANSQTAKHIGLLPSSNLETPLALHTTPHQIESGASEAKESEGCKRVRSRDGRVKQSPHSLLMTPDEKKNLKHTPSKNSRRWQI